MKIFFIPFWFLIVFTKSHNCLGLDCPSQCGLQEKGSQASLWVLLAGCHLEGETWSFVSPVGKAPVAKFGGFLGKHIHSEGILGGDLPFTFWPALSPCPLPLLLSTRPQ